MEVTKMDTLKTILLVKNLRTGKIEEIKTFSHADFEDDENVFSRVIREKKALRKRYPSGQYKLIEGMAESAYSFLNTYPEYRALS